jgi:clan AA aspartic protease (TIGR02281 family)
MGIGVIKDEKKAFSLYKQSAEKGCAYGQRLLAFAYYDAIGTPKDGDLAVYWMKKAKDNGDEAAEEILNDLQFLVDYDKGYHGQQVAGKEMSSSITVIMNKRNSVYYVHCKINGLKADFVFDTGAGAISLSSDFAKRLVDMGVLSDNDITGRGKSMIADGNTTDVLVVNIKDVEIGGLHLNNVIATIKQQQNAPLLLGQSAIEKLGKITIDGYKLIIHRN